MASPSDNEFRLNGLRDKERFSPSAITLSSHLYPQISARKMEIQWIKEQNSVCLYRNGFVTEGNRYRNRVSLFHNQLEKGNVSLKITDCTEEDEGNYHCRVTDGNRTAELIVGVEIDFSSTSCFSGKSDQVILVYTANSGPNKIKGKEEEMKRKKEKAEKCFVLPTGNAMNADKDFMHRLNKQIPLQQVDQVEKSEIILVFCPVASRVGTDIEAALQKFNHLNAPETRPVVLVVLHHTFNPDQTVPDSSRCVNRPNTITVDCLFHEDQGLLQCKKNDESVTKTKSHIKSQSFRRTFSFRKRDPHPNKESHPNLRRHRSVNYHESRAEARQASAARDAEARRGAERSLGGQSSGYPGPAAVDVQQTRPRDEETIARLQEELNEAKREIAMLQSENDKLKMEIRNHVCEKAKPPRYSELLQVQDTSRQTLRDDLRKTTEERNERPHQSDGKEREVQKELLKRNSQPQHRIPLEQNKSSSHKKRPQSMF